MKKHWIALILFIVSSPLLAEDPPPIKPGVDGRVAGDIVAPFTDAQVAAWCDFTKQIIMTRFSILCVYKGPSKPES